jgi:hypothetical protein
MKLSDWAKTQGISYLTAYRWFKDGKLPVEAYQSESGTIIIKDVPGTSEQTMAGNNQSNDSMSLFLKKTVEFSKNNSSVEEFAAYVLSNFSLKLSNSIDSSPKYSKNKPKSEDVQKHFQKFLKSKDEGSKPVPRMFVTDSNTLEQLGINEEAGVNSSVALNSASTPDMQTLINDLAAAISPSPLPILPGNVVTYDSLGEYEGVVCRDTLTPQSINYTSSTNSTLVSPTFSMSVGDSIVQPAVLNGFQPSSEDIANAHRAVDKLADDIRSTVKVKRGRKPSKKVEKK